MELATNGAAIRYYSLLSQWSDECSLLFSVLAMRNYIVNLIIELASNENTLRSTNAYINKLDEILVQILKKDWPKYWPTFIHEMVESSKANPALCENNMKILQYLR